MIKIENKRAGISQDQRSHWRGIDDPISREMLKSYLIMKYNNKLKKKKNGKRKLN